MDILNEQNEIINISVFGPADHGKSTFIGYLYSIFRKNDFEQYIHRVKNIWGTRYDVDKEYAYVSDRHLSEQIGRKEEAEKGRGTTQHTHPLKIPIENKNFLFHDNPGHFKWKKETSKGLLRGDYGIFVIAIDALRNSLEIFDSLTKKDTLITVPGEVREYVEPLYIALNLGLKLGFIVFSKMDIVNYDEY